MPITQREEADPSPERSDDTNLTQSGQTQLNETLIWLKENYERSEGVCLPRCVLYTHYLDLCKKRIYSPAGAATFGKIIRQMFPKLTTRRLGTRGQSKYHYYGIGIKKTSIYYHSVYSGKGLSRFSETKVKTEGSARKFSLSSKSGTLLPDFPTAGNLLIPSSISADKVETFLLMYQTHCQRILDTVVSSNFEEAQNFLLHFWQGMPKHMQSLLSTDVIIDVIALCDSILYKVLTDVLIPSVIQDIPEGLSFDILTFAKKLPVWLESSLDQICDKLRTRKMKVLSSFVKGLRRQISFVQLAQTTRSVLLSQEMVGQMTRDLAEISFNGNAIRADISQSSADAARAILQEFNGLLGKQAPLEAYIEWTDSLIDRFVLQETTAEYSDRSAAFMLHWSFFTSQITRDLTLQSASSFGSLHLIHMMLTEYAFLVLEGQQDQLYHAEMVDHVQRNMKRTEEICTKATVRSSFQRSSPGSTSVKSKRRKCSNQTEESPSKDAHDPYSVPDDIQCPDAEYQDGDTATSELMNNTKEKTLHVDNDFNEPCVATPTNHTDLPSSNYAFRPYSSQKDVQSVVDGGPSFTDDQYQSGNYLSSYANSYCDLYPVRMPGHANSPYKHHQHDQPHLSYGSYNTSALDNSGYSGYATGYELTALPGQHSVYGPPAHSRMDMTDGHSCYMRAGEALSDGHRHSYLRFNTNYDDFVGNQTHHAGKSVWFTSTTPSCATEPPPTGILTYPPTDDIPRTAGSATVGSGGHGGSRFMEIVHHGSGSGMTPTGVYEPANEDYHQMSRMMSLYPRGNAHLTQPRPYTGPYR